MHAQRDKASRGLNVAVSIMSAALVLIRFEAKITPAKLPAKLMRPILLTSILVAFALVACTAPTVPDTSLFAAEAENRFELPNALREISGLAVSPDGRVFGHDDEHATIYEIDVTRGAVVKSFSIGDPAETGDFEGLAIAPNGDFWLTDSRGRLMRFREGGDRATVDAERFDTGVGETCEVEGITYQPSDQSFVLACKRMRGRGQRTDAPQLRVWRVGAQETRAWGPITADVAEAAGVSDFQPSDIAFDPASGRLIVISGLDGAIAEFGPDGALLSARALGHRHRQAEGVAVLPDGSLIIADEGGNDRAHISRYLRRP